MRAVRCTRLFRHGERGVVLPLVALLLVALSGMVALSVDIGRLAQTRRQLQNAADAAALAGAWRLPGNTTQAKADAATWAQQNGLTAAEVTNVTISTTNFTDDTIQVTTRRTVPYAFARVFNLLSGDVTATATVTLFVVQGVDTESPGIFPYAVWGGNKKGPSDVKPGNSVTYRSNQYANINVQPIPSCSNKPKDNCNWNIQSNSFKGYFHWHDRYTYIDAETKQVENQGGNAFGTEPIDDLVKYQQKGTPVWLPLINWADDDGSNLHFRIVNFVCVQLDPIDEQGSTDWTGTVLDPQAAGSKCNKNALRSGGEPPAANLMPLYTYVLTK